MHMSYGQKIKEIRRAHLLSQEEFAQRIGVSRSILSQIEIDKIKPGLEALTNISKEFGVSLEYLLDKEQGVQAESSGIHRLSKSLLHPTRLLNKPFFASEPAGFDKIRYVSIKARTQLDYIPSYSWILHQQFPYIQIPNLGVGNHYVAFEVGQQDNCREQVLVCSRIKPEKVQESDFLLVPMGPVFEYGQARLEQQGVITVNGRKFHWVQLHDLWKVELVIGKPERPDLNEQVQELRSMLEQLLRSRS